ncbi:MULTISPECIES: hypothetical protein [unclassified Clostridium]|uniref:hypothetical protein n=1 Tax=unclassified Clostridium TaxID=2614128 RepID=UPI0020796E26|nr:MULTISPECIES: hypothetical protein [unclassified Clostridium]
MAKRNENTETVEEKQYKGTAKQCIKYAGQFLNIGDKFDIAEKDVEELKQYADIEETEVQGEGQEGE